jgi:hypothetical protein
MPTREFKREEERESLKYPASGVNRGCKSKRRRV